MNTYKLKFTKLQSEIFRLLCINAGESFSQRQVATMLGVSPPAIAKSLPMLQKTELANVIKNKTMKLKYIKLNRDSAKTLHLKRAENLRQIYEAYLSDFLEENFPGTTIILFGSYSRGDDTIKSDIDIAVIGGKEKNIDLTKFEKILCRKIIINFYSSLKSIDKELRENLCNGIVIAGGILL